MYYECSDCGQMAELHGRSRDEFVEPCPVCGEATTWEFAFEGEGVSF